MKKIKKVEELKKIVADDSRALQILVKISKENSKDYRRHIYGNVFGVIGIACICFGIFAGGITEDANITGSFIIVALLLCYVSGCLKGLFCFDSKAVIRDDELVFLNAVLKERTMTSMGKLSVIQKGDQCFIDENGVFEYIGKAKNQTMTECEKFIYKQIEDWEGLYPQRYVVFQCSEVSY